MQFMIIRKADAATEALVPPAPGLVEDMARFHQQLADEGRLGMAWACARAPMTVRSMKTAL
jgi:hypothetical protein